MVGTGLVTEIVGVIEILNAETVAVNPANSVLLASTQTPAWSCVVGGNLKQICVPETPQSLSTKQGLPFDVLVSPSGMAEVTTGASVDAIGTVLTKR